MGVEIATRFAENPTHFVVPKYKRTMPMLIAVNLGLTIITAEWVDNSVEKGELLPPKNYSVSSDATTNLTTIASTTSKW